MNINNSNYVGFDVLAVEFKKSLLVYAAVKSSKSKLSCLLSADVFLGIFFTLENGSNMCL
jgi:hypothetical protein